MESQRRFQTTASSRQQETERKREKENDGRRKLQLTCSIRVGSLREALQLLQAIADVRARAGLRAVRRRRLGSVPGDGPADACAQR